MTLGDLLDELRNNILRDRSSQVSGPSDQLWTDTALVRYIGEAQRRFARQGLVIRDGVTPQCCTVQLVAGQSIYPLDPSVIAVISAKYASDPCDLARAGHAAFGTYHTPDSYFFDPSSLSSLPPGKVLAYSTDEQVSADDNGTMTVVNLRAYPVPAAPYTTPLQLRVVRLPLEPLCLEYLDAVPEIPEDFHFDMLDWAAYLALRIVDHDAGDVARSEGFKASFEAHVLEARKAAMRKMFTPMQWGFGRNGFSWEGN